MILKKKCTMKKKHEKQILQRIFSGSLVDSLVKFLDHFTICLPIDTCVGDTHSRFEVLRKFLISFIQVSLNHNSDNTFISIFNLTSNICRHFRLVAMVFLAISVRCIDDDSGRNSF